MTKIRVCQQQDRLGEPGRERLEKETWCNDERGARETIKDMGERE